MTKGENMSQGACVRVPEGLPVVMSLNPTTLAAALRLPGRRAHRRRAGDGGACPRRRSAAAGSRAVDASARTGDAGALRGRGRAGRLLGPGGPGAGPGVARRPGLLDRVRDAWRRPWFPVGGLVAIAAAAFFAFRPAAPVPASAGRRGPVGDRRYAVPAPAGGAEDRDRRRHHLAGRAPGRLGTTGRPSCRPTSRVLRRRFLPSRDPARGSCDRARQRGRRSAWPESSPPLR